VERNFCLRFITASADSLSLRWAAAGKKFFGTALLQPARSVCVSLSAFLFLVSGIWQVIKRKQNEAKLLFRGYCPPLRSPAFHRGIGAVHLRTANRSSPSKPTAFRWLCDNGNNLRYKLCRFRSICQW